MNRKTLDLFRIFLTIGAFTFGGGYAMIPLIEKEVVDKRGWMEKNEFIDSLALCQSTPGALAVNSAVFIGYKLHGFIGGMAAALGVVMPSFLIILGIAAVFTTLKDYAVVDAVFIGVRACVVALISSAGVRLFNNINSKGLFSFIVIIGSFITIAFLNINPFYIVIGAAFLGICKNLFLQQRIQTHGGKEHGIS